MSVQRADSVAAVRAGDAAILNYGGYEFGEFRIDAEWGSSAWVAYDQALAVALGFIAIWAEAQAATEGQPVIGGAK